MPPRFESSSPTKSLVVDHLGLPPIHLEVTHHFGKHCRCSLSQKLLKKEAFLVYSRASLLATCLDKDRLRGRKVLRNVQQLIIRLIHLDPRIVFRRYRQCIAALQRSDASPSVPDHVVNARAMVLAALDPRQPTIPSTAKVYCHSLHSYEQNTDSYAFDRLSLSSG